MHAYCLLAAGLHALVLPLGQTHIAPLNPAVDFFFLQRGEGGRRRSKTRTRPGQRKDGCA